MKKAFQVDGDFQMGRVRQNFTMQVVAKDPAEATERAFTAIGSRHGANRRQVRVTQVAPLADDDVSPITRQRLGS